MSAPSRMVRAFSVSLVAVGAFMLDTPNVAQALDCRAAPVKEAKERWVYRTVDGKRCWFAWSKSSPESKLQWSRSALKDLEQVRNVRAAIPPAQPPAAPAAEAPAVPAVSSPEITKQEEQGMPSFDARWRGLGL